ncbi:MAG: cytochrome C [Spirochaetes bacterium]|nr:MAG: cytochrome C [Spirochaetota bacterium]
MKRSVFSFLGLISFILFSFLSSSNLFSKTLTVDVNLKRPLITVDCLKCHEDDVSPSGFANSVHGQNGCTSCHVDIFDLEKHEEGEIVPGKPKCGLCHQQVCKEYKKSVHKVLAHMDCWACHKNIHTLTKWDGNKKAIIMKCTSCHEKKKYVTSGHAKAIIAGNNDSAACSDCHGLHNTKILHSSVYKYPKQAREFYTRTCNKCHANKELMERNNKTVISVASYKRTYHGKVQELGYPTHVAGCADCHTSHSILPKNDPNSPINERNLIKNCSKCHLKANKNFVKYFAHPDFKNKNKYPLLFWTVVAMDALIISVLIFFWFHTFLWWRKSYWEKYKRMISGEANKDAELKSMTFIRFKWRDRILHFVMMMSFFGLATTGLPLKYPNSGWARVIIGFLGGPDVAGFLHRTSAIFLSACFFIVVGLGIHFLFFNKKIKGNWKERLTGPDSFWFRKKDFQDLAQMIRWFIDMDDPPKFDRFTYWEKFDIMAVFWGMMAIGISGAVLWWPEFTSKFLPGWVFNIAEIIHSEEALLAIVFIFTVHFFNTHFIPTKFPMNYAIFTGRITGEELIEERALQYERLKEEGKLEEVKTSYPDILTNLISGIIGFAALTVGLIFIVLIAWALFKH